MKKTYQSPVMKTVKVEVVAMQGASKVQGNAGINLGGQGGEQDEAQSRRSSIWDDEE